jgi:hypothetical protein
VSYYSFLLPHSSLLALLSILFLLRPFSILSMLSIFPIGTNTRLNKCTSGKMGSIGGRKIKRLEFSNIADNQWTATIHEWKRRWNDGSANWLLLDSNSLAIPPDMMIDE